MTPGPWKWQNIDGVWYLRSVAAIERSTCPDFNGTDPIIDDGSAGGEYSQTIDPRTSPNAHPIAAAPDMYAALSFTEILLSFMVAKADKLPPTLAEAFQQAKRKASSALAKARGEAA